MKTKAFIALIFVAASIVTPVSFTLSGVASSGVAHDNPAVIMTLDVCHAGGGALSPDADTPALVDTNGEVRYVAPDGTPLLILAPDRPKPESYLKHHPPKAA
jgi:hypothetical protein